MDRRPERQRRRGRWQRRRRVVVNICAVLDHVYLIRRGGARQIICMLPISTYYLLTGSRPSIFSLRQPWRSLFGYH